MCRDGLIGDVAAGVNSQVLMKPLMPASCMSRSVTCPIALLSFLFALLHIVLLSYCPIVLLSYDIVHYCNIAVFHYFTIAQHCWRSAWCVSSVPRLHALCSMHSSARTVVPLQPVLFPKHTKCFRVWRTSSAKLYRALHTAVLLLSCGTTVHV